MNILQVTPYFAPAWAYGGPPRVVYELSRELVHRGHTVTVLTTDASDAESRVECAHEVLEGIEVFRLRNLSNQVAWRQQTFLPFGTTRFFRRAKRYDVIHMHMFRTLLNIPAHHFAMKSRVPYVLSAHGSLPRIIRRKASKAVFDLIAGQRILRDARKLVAVSGAERLDYIAAGVPEPRVSLIANGIDTSAYENLPLPGEFAKDHGLNGWRLVTYLGRLNSRKGLDQLLQAFRLLADEVPDLVLVIAGPDDGYGAQLARQCEEMMISSRVFFPGFLSNQGRLRLLVDSSVVVYPAPREPFGLVPFEALLCGRPVVVSKDSGSAELLEEVGADVAIPPNNPMELKAALLACLRGDMAISEKVRRGKAFVVTRLSWNQILPRLEMVYEEAAESVPDS